MDGATVKLGPPPQEVRGFWWYHAREDSSRCTALKLCKTPSVVKENVKEVVIRKGNDVFLVGGRVNYCIMLDVRRISATFILHSTIILFHQKGKQAALILQITVGKVTWSTTYAAVSAAKHNKDFNNCTD